MMEGGGKGELENVKRCNHEIGSTCAKLRHIGPTRPAQENPPSSPCTMGTIHPHPFHLIHHFTPANSHRDARTNSTTIREPSRSRQRNTQTFPPNSPDVTPHSSLPLRSTTHSGSPPSRASPHPYTPCLAWTYSRPDSRSRVKGGSTRLATASSTRNPDDPTLTIQ